MQDGRAIGISTSVQTAAGDAIVGGNSSAWLRAKADRLKHLQDTQRCRDPSSTALATAKLPADFLQRKLELVNRGQQALETKIAHCRASHVQYDGNALLSQLPLVAHPKVTGDECGALTDNERAALRRRLAVLERSQRIRAAQMEDHATKNEKPADEAAILFASLLHESSSTRQMHTSDRLLPASRALDQEQSEARSRESGIDAGSASALAASLVDMAAVLASSREAREQARAELSVRTHDAEAPQVAMTRNGPSLAATRAEMALADSRTTLTQAHRLGLV